MAARLGSEGRRLIRANDLVAAQRVFRRLRAVAPADPSGLLGLGEVHLQLGRPEIALLYAAAAAELAPGSDLAAALEVRGLLRARRFDAAVEKSRNAVAIPGAGPELWAAHASALFRVQETSQAATAYRKVLALDPMHAEAHIRLGSGLTAPREVTRSPALRDAVQALRVDDVKAAIELLQRAVGEQPDNPIAHRLLGDALLRHTALSSMAVRSPEFVRLAEVIPVPEVNHLPLEKFMPAYPTLQGPRRRVATRALALFGSYMPRLVSMAGRHDLLAELERTTDASARANLRGQRTFDGRVWDDVRGIGGLRAATGIEALDDVEQYGYDTLTHEVTHQAHLYAFGRLNRQRVQELFRDARTGNKFLDYYAANNEAEYFGQGVEAFVSYGKRPGREPTHGHTRFELYRVDRELYDFIAGVVDYDPLRNPRLRAKILPVAVEVALRSGRPEDAVEAAKMMARGEARTRLLAAARRAEFFSRSY